MSIQEDLLRRAREYTQRHSLVLGDQLGSGLHGTVFQPRFSPLAESISPERIDSSKARTLHEDHARARLTHRTMDSRLTPSPLPPRGGVWRASWNRGEFDAKRLCF